MENKKAYKELRGLKNNNRKEVDNMDNMILNESFESFAQCFESRENICVLDASFLNWIDQNCSSSCTCRKLQEEVYNYSRFQEGFEDWFIDAREFNMNETSYLYDNEARECVTIPDCCINCMEFEDDIFYCDFCGQWEYGDHFHLNNGEDMCEEGMGEEYGFGICEDCGEAVPYDDLTYSSRDCAYYCNDCIENHTTDLIRGYHDKNPNFAFIGGNAQDGVYFGFEIECVPKDWNDIEEVVEGFEYDFKNKYGESSKNFGTFEEDGSLNDGVEFVTFPLDSDNMVPFIANVTNLLKRNGADVDYSCGGHIHITRNEFTKAQLPKMLMFLQNNKRDVIRFSGRDVEEFNRWSKLYWTEYDYIDEEIALDYIYNDTDRYRAINTQNINTIEFRLFDGTLSAYEILANVEFIKVLLYAPITKTWNFRDIKEYAIKNGYNNLVIKLCEIF